MSEPMVESVNVFDQQNRLESLKMNPELEIYTVENVAVRFPIASVVLRALAYAIDLNLQILLLISAFIAFFQLAPDIASTRVFFAILIAIYVVFFHGYFVLQEGITGGRTIGKRILKMRVIRLDGGPAGWREALIREVFRFVDFFPAWYFVGILYMVFSTHLQRAGDRVAGTVVIYEGKLRKRHESTYFTTELPLTEAETLWVNQFLERRATLLPEKRKEMLQKAVTYFYRRYADLPVWNEIDMSQDPEDIFYRVFKV